MIKQLMVFTIATLIFNLAYADEKISNRERKLYVGSNSSEAIMKFKGVVEYKSIHKPTEKTLRKVIESQIEHIVGPMSDAELKAVPKGDHVITGVKILSVTESTYKIGYRYSGTIVLENSTKNTHTIYLPVNPALIFKAGMVGNYNPCTDKHYQSAQDFWYFWNPNQKDCPLIKNKDYVITDARIKRIINSELTYPEYQNLPDGNGNITLHVFFGMNDPSLDRNALTSLDINADNYRKFRTYLIQNGYVAREWTDKEINDQAQSMDGTKPFVETMTKGKMIYRFFFGATGIDEDSMAFHWFYKDALENASVMMYLGHSGLGGHLDLESIEENLGVTINVSKKYQIYFFNSCTSYRYYNTQYFARKITTLDPNGTKNLDIFANGLSTYFSVLANTAANLGMAIDASINLANTNKKYLSFQSLAEQIDSENLFGVIGDEDNVVPTKDK